MSKERHTCPRRAHVEPMPTDTWERGRGLIGRQNREPSCSYCGSLHPDMFMAWLRDGGMLELSTKSYKAYITCPYDDPRVEDRIDLKPGEKVPRRWRKMLGMRRVSETSGGYSASYGMQAKFYWRHLRQDQWDEWIAMHNEGRINYGKYGALGVLPFFATSNPRRTDD